MFSFVVELSSISSKTRKFVILFSAILVFFFYRIENNFKLIFQDTSTNIMNNGYKRAIIGTHLDTYFEY